MSAATMNHAELNGTGLVRTDNHDGLTRGALVGRGDLGDTRRHGDRQGMRSFPEGRSRAGHPVHCVPSGPVGVCQAAGLEQIRTAQRDATLALAGGLPRNYTLLADLQLPICATTNYDGFLARAIGATGVANPSVDQQIRTRGLNRRSRAAARFRDPTPTQRGISAAVTLG